MNRIQSGLCCMAAFGLPLVSQAFLVSGQILEKGVRVPISGAALELEIPSNAPTAASQAPNTTAPTVTPLPTVSYSATADPQGRYQVEVPSGTYWLRLAAEGYRPTDLDSFPVEKDLKRDFYLERETFSLPEVVVSAAKDQQPSRETLSKEELSAVPGTGGDVLRALQTLPGTYSAGDFWDALLIRGAGPLDNLYLLDGIPLFFPFHFGGLLSALNSASIEKVDFSAGGFGPEHGNAYGGLIDTTQKTPRTDRWGGRLEITPIFSEAGVEGPLTPDSSFSLSGRRSYLEVLSGFLTQFSPIPAFDDYQAKWSWNPSKDFQGNLLAFGSGDELGFQTQPGFSVNRNIGSVGSISYHNGFDSQGGNFRWTLDPQDTLTDVFYHSTFSLGASLRTGYYFNLQSEDFGNRLDWNRDLGAGFQVQSGLEYVHETSLGSMNSNLLMGQDDLDPFNFSFYSPYVQGAFSAPSEHPSAYLDAKFRTSDQRLELSLGGRWDYQSFNQESDLSPRLSAGYRFTETTALKASWGLYTQEPFLGLYSIASPRISSEQARDAVVGVEQKLGESLQLRLEAYQKDLSRIIELNPFYSYPSYTNGETGYSKGLEIFLRYLPSDRFFGWISYDLSDSKRQDFAGAPWHPYAYDQPNVVTAVGGYKLAPNWEAGFKAHYASGLPYTPVVGTIYYGGNYYNPVFGPEYSARFPDYFRLDFSTSLTTLYDTWQWKIYLEIWNATGSNNVLTYAYNNDFSQREPIGEFPFLPYLGFEADF